MAAPYTPAPEAFECVGFADFVVDVAGHRVTGRGGRDVPLRRAEFTLLLAFLRAPGRVLSRDHLLDAVAGRESGPFDRSIDVLVSRLRRKIEPEPRSPRLILTVPGVGYRFAGQRFAVPAPPARVTGAEECQPRSTERRQLTVMLCGTGGAGGMSACLDPEDLAPLLRSYQELCEQVIRRFGGMVARSVNDGVLGYFGYPEAAEDDAEQAVRAGLAVIREVPSVDDRLRARVGIATGLAIAGGPGVLGEPIEVASRLLALAAPDTLVISASCQRLTGGLFEYEPLPAGGFTCSEHGFRVIGEAPVESRFEALHQCGLTPLFGRAEELTLLMRRWDQAGMGAGKVILISGEAGIGKSRIIREFGARVSEDECFPLVFPVRRTANTVRITRSRSTSNARQGSGTPTVTRAAGRSCGRCCSSSTRRRMMSRCLPICCP
jgi:class 3 adenylate cyclase